jgi:hypothetical protein
VDRKSGNAGYESRCYFGTPALYSHRKQRFGRRSRTFVAESFPQIGIGLFKIDGRRAPPSRSLILSFQSLLFGLLSMASLQSFASAGSYEG